MAFDEVVGHAADGGCGERVCVVAIVAQWTDAAVGAKPDRDFGVFGAGGVGNEGCILGVVAAGVAVEYLYQLRDIASM